MNLYSLYIFKLAKCLRRKLWIDFLKEKRDNKEKKTFVFCTIFKLAG